MSLRKLTESELVKIIKKSLLSENKLGSPVWPYKRISSEFGPRDIGRNASKDHKGIDIACNVGTPIRSPEAGRVIDAKFPNTYKKNGKKNSCGAVIFIDHREAVGKRFKTRYCHCSKVLVSKGDWVEKGQIVGLTGGEQDAEGAGNSTGPHLHFEAYGSGDAENPRNFFNFTKPLEGSDVIDTKNLEPKVDLTNIENSEIAKLDSQDIDAIISNNDNSLLFRRGSKGRGVQEIQKILLKLGYELPRFGADGDYGNETKTAVKEFQKDNDLFVDGIVGINTAKKLREKSKGLTISESSLVEMIQRIITEKKKRKSKKKKKSNTLCARGKRAAKAKFEVYPSAYANGYAVQVCKGKMPGLDGKKKCSGKYCSGKK